MSCTHTLLYTGLQRKTAQSPQTLKEHAAPARGRVAPRASGLSRARSVAGLVFKPEVKSFLQSRDLCSLSSPGRAAPAPHRRRAAEEDAADLHLHSQRPARLQSSSPAPRGPHVLWSDQYRCRFHAQSLLEYRSLSHHRRRSPSAWHGLSAFRVMMCQQNGTIRA